MPQVDSLAQGRAPIVEDRVEQMALEAHDSGRLYATTDQSMKEFADRAERS